MYKILVCDDETKIRETFYDYLSAKGFAVTLSSNGREAVEKCGNESFDLVILDVMMPEMNGFEACRRIRCLSDAPVLFLSALGEEQDLLNGYGLGADDYIIKPFPLAVLVKKCNALINRYTGSMLQDEISFFGITLNKPKQLVTVDGNAVPLTNKTFRLLELLMINKGIVLSREQILVKVWGWDFDGDERVVDTHIKKLRKALGNKAVHIRTVIGGGYSFREE